MIPKLAELRRLPDEELARRYDQEAPRTQVGTGFYLDELHRRESHRLAQQMMESTVAIRRLTCLITGLTALNAVAVAISLFR